MSLAGKIALVTGAGRGLGREHALALARAGATVVVNDLGGTNTGDGHDTRPAQEVVAEIEAAGGRAFADTRSVSDWNAAHAMVADAVERFGDLDILVNNAGINRAGLFGDISEADWDLAAAVNFKGVTATMNAAAAHWRRAGPKAGRAIVNTASPAGLHPVPYISVYSATKAAVASLTVTAAQELAALGVRVNAVAPMARTRMLEGAPQEMIDMMAPREGFDPNSPEHIAQVVAFLASPHCQFTGRVFGAWGGDLFLFDEWDAAHHVSSGGKTWTLDTLAEATAGLPVQQRRWTLFPGGRLEGDNPPSEALAALNSAGETV
jgi:NAD(P)-dependent dehydrogenase (short-subunit alcohol dehydrogenase family)